MNRQLRRQAARQKPPAPTRRWQFSGSKPRLHEIDFVFSPVERAFSQLASGEIDSVQGRPCFVDQEGVMYELAPALRGFASALHRISAAHSLDIDFAPVLKLCNRLDASMPITPELVAQCSAIITRFRVAYQKMDMYKVGSLVNTELIALEMESLNKGAKP